MSAPVFLNRLGKESINFLRDLSLSNQYIVEFTLGSELREFLKIFNYIKNDTSGSQEYGLLCAEASLPGSTFATSEVKDNFLGVTQEFAHTRLYTDIDMTFYVDRKYKILELFQGWMDFISGAEGAVTSKATANSLDPGFYRRFRYPDRYKTRVLIGKFERDYGLESKVNNFYERTYTLINAFPKSISSIPISYGPADILKITITFNYDRYIVNKISNFKETTAAAEESSNSTIKPEQEGAPVLDALGNPLIKPSWYKGTFEQYQEDYNSGVNQGATNARIRRESALPGPRSNKPWDR